MWELELILANISLVENLLVDPTKDRPSILKKWFQSKLSIGNVISIERRSSGKTSISYNGLVCDWDWQVQIMGNFEELEEKLSSQLSIIALETGDLVTEKVYCRWNITMLLKFEMIAYFLTYQGQLLNEVDKLERHVLALENRLRQVRLENSTQSCSDWYLSWNRRRGRKG